MIKSYAGDYSANTLTDEKAKKLLDEALAIEEAQLKLRRSYSQKLAQVLPQKKVARYLQIENKIRSALNYELADGIRLWNSGPFAAEGILERAAKDSMKKNLTAGFPSDEEGRVGVSQRGDGGPWSNRLPPLTRWPPCR